ncbi:phosphonate C-P lyase system protein PhnH [Roseospirillum parvum]|uniref:Alpha-D-ribose 1-methylphosphonate 5-triphosphate synthase subunit PhnH n=1 Tax=Roseospirillum parvum TaxID=83401 RepID=A0A1G8ETK4_9PROT|nr:phosphonate C-P lyase system protein PhnH [Roseospirillum parvum]SDH73157.1 alpha-D-ribose 1-methylphosphonate 5-triphosphate synthase subunit PhnH [Roseospirillum parvum]
MTAAAHLLPGFADPVTDSQAVFRATLEALSRPGTVLEVPAALAPPAPLSPAAGAVLLTLADLDTPLWLAPGSGSEAVIEWLAFHCGCPRVADPGHAALAVAARPGGTLALDIFTPGSPTRPEGSTTLLLEVDDLAGGPPLTLAGPGIDGTARLAPAGLPEGFAESWRANRALFPQGIDVILTAGRHLAGLPRTTTLKEG